MNSFLKPVTFFAVLIVGFTFVACAPPQQSSGLSGVSMKTRTKEGRNLDIQISANQVVVTETLSSGSQVRGSGRNMTEAMKDLDKKKASQ